MQKVKYQSSSSWTRLFRLALLFCCGLVIALGLAWRVVDATTLGNWVQQLTVILEHPSEVNTKVPILDETPLTLPSPPTAPVRIGVLQDKSGSIDEHRVESPDAESLRALAEILIPSGGEMAVSSICSDSDRPFIRKRIEEPLLLEVSQLNNPDLPVSVDENLNAFAKRQDQQRFEDEIAAFMAARSEDEQLIDAHHQGLKVHAQEAKIQLEAFVDADLAPILNTPANCQETDIWGAIARAELFLLESPDSWRTPPTLFLIVITDGLDTAAKRPVAISDDIQILLVNGSASTGVFESIDHLAFENFAAATAYITAAVEQ